VKNTFKFAHRIRLTSGTLLLSVSYMTLGMLAQVQETHAQSSGAAPLPPVTVTAPEAKRRSTGASSTRADNNSRKRRQQVARREPTPPKPFAVSQDGRTGSVGVYADSTSVATKTNTPLINIPQSLSVITKDFIRDQSPQNLTDVTRYVPGVAVHQGEGNRDELVIRGVDTSANFFVNGFRDDVQSLQCAKRRGPERTGRDHLRPWRRWRPAQPDAQGSRWHKGL
jgi:catecholate siderophore receptor